MTSRREFLRLGAVVGAVGTAGCIEYVTSTIDEGGVTSVDDARAAVVRIVTEGTYAEYGDEVIAGAGSGFVIDPSGIVVTNNHVVAGGVTIEVFVGSEQRSHNATVLGVSECADLAVLDVEGEDFTSLNWYDGEPESGLEVWALGYPGGDPSYTTTNGTVTGITSEPTSWASVDAEVEHSAQLEGGSSGGPLVDENGRVIGVNYSGIDPLDQFGPSQSFAIAASVASDLVEVLREGEDVHSIGLSGVAVPADTQTPAGIWVSAITTGSPASNAGIQPGDVITALERLPMAGDGTMREYCRVLRSHEAGDVLSVQVYRDGTILEGEINGRELEPIEGEEVIESEPTDSYGEYVVVTDDTDTIQVAIPAEWSDVAGQPVDSGPALIAAPNVDEFLGTYETPGVRIYASRESGVDLEAVLNEFADMQCTLNEPVEYSDPLYTGLAREGTTCGGTQSSIVHIAAVPGNESFVILVEVQIVDERDWEAFSRIQETFQVIREF